MTKLSLKRFITEGGNPEAQPYPWEFQGSPEYNNLLKVFPGHAKLKNPKGSPQYEWAQQAIAFVKDPAKAENERAAVIKFFQNMFFGVDYDDTDTDAEIINWWISPEEQKFIQDELNAEPEIMNEVKQMRNKMQRIGENIVEADINELSPSTYASAFTKGQERGDTKGKDIAKAAFRQALGKYVNTGFEFKIIHSDEPLVLLIDSQSTIANVGYPFTKGDLVVIAKDAQGERYYLRLWQDGTVGAENMDSRHDVRLEASRMTANNLTNLYNQLKDSVNAPGAPMSRNQIKQY